MWCDLLRNSSLFFDLNRDGVDIVEVFLTHPIIIFFVVVASGADLTHATQEEWRSMNCKAALMDCDQALELESGNVKARYRRAQALQGLGKLADAVDAAVSTLNVAPKTMEREVKAFLDKLKVEMKEKEKKSVREKISTVSLDDRPPATKPSDNILDSILLGSGTAGASSTESRWPAELDVVDVDTAAAAGEKEKKKEKKGPLIEVISSTEH